MYEDTPGGAQYLLPSKCHNYNRERSSIVKMRLIWPCIVWYEKILVIAIASDNFTFRRSFVLAEGGGPRVVVSTAAFHARVRGLVPGLGGFKETKMFLPHPRVKVSIVGSLRDREVACSASDRQGSNFESCVWRTVSSHSSHHPQEVLQAQFSLYVHKGGLKPDSFHFICISRIMCYLEILLNVFVPTSHFIDNIFPVLLPYVIICTDNCSSYNGSAHS